jgi:sulfatase modifying factor 1
VAEIEYLERYVAGLCTIPSGDYCMGELKSRSDQQPVRAISVSQYRLGAAPVTVALWREYCNFTDQRMPEMPAWGWHEDHPIVNVSWDDIIGINGTGGFCTWASRIAGIEFSLPTEAQFEYVARGGRGYVFPWGNKFEYSKLWCARNNDSDYITMTASLNRSIRAFRDSYGMLDLIGNVRHWCLDWYGPYQCGSRVDPLGAIAPSNARRVVRGGGWDESSHHKFRSYFRSSWYPMHGCQNIGFRLAAGPG